MGPWQSRETSLALDRQAREPDFRVIPVLLPGSEGPLGFLGLQTWIDFKDGITEGALSLLAAAITPDAVDQGGLLDEADSPRLSVSPYRGLRPFREEDASLFFGRHAFTKLLVDAVDKEPVVFVVGPSGSGKSSVVRAGLIPHLRRAESTSAWDIVTTVPGRYPLRTLASAFLPKLEPEMPSSQRLLEVPRLTDSLTRKEITLSEVVEAALSQQPGTDRMLLVVDQWEELYTLAEDNDEVLSFITTILDATAHQPLSVVATMRGDFYGKAISDRVLADRLQTGLVNLSTMTRPELMQAIVKPAESVGLSFEDGLVVRVLDDVGDEPGNLPLLEFVLEELWSRRADSALTIAAYEGMNGLQGAIAQRAEDVVGVEELPAARAVFLHLVEPNADSPDTRRRAALSEIRDDLEPMLRRLSDARLVVTSRDEATGDETVEIAHEALINGWSRLKGWIAEDREFLLWRGRLGAAMEAWRAANRDDGAMLRGAPLVEAEAWVDERGQDLSPEEQDFVARSRLIASRGRRRVIWTLVAGLVFFALLAGIASAFALDQRNEAIAAFGDVEQSQMEVARLTEETVQLAAAAAEARSDLAIAENVLNGLEALVTETGLEAEAVLKALEEAEAGRAAAEVALGTVQEAKDLLEAEMAVIQEELAVADEDLEVANARLAEVDSLVEDQQQALDQIEAAIDEACNALFAGSFNAVVQSVYDFLCVPRGFPPPTFGF